MRRNDLLAGLGALLVTASLAAPSARARADPTSWPWIYHEVALETASGRVIGPINTKAKGEAKFSNLEPGSYAVIIPDASILPGPAGLRISADVSTIRVQNYVFNNSAGQRGKVYAVDQSGQRLVIPVAKDGGTISLQLTIFDRWGNLRR